MNRTRRYLLGIVAALLGGCSAAATTDTPDIDNYFAKADFIGDSDTGNPLDRWYGQTEFHSVAPRWDFLPMRTLEAAGEADASSKDVQRTVEESDIYRYDEARGVLYVLNSYRGLQVLDVSNPDAPALMGTVELGGYPMEMFQEGDFAYVLLNSYEAREATQSYYGAVLRVLDLSDPTNPVRMGEDFLIDGSVQGSRMLPARDADGNLVSAVIYVASHMWTRVGGEDGTTWEPKSFVQAINVTDPTRPYAVDQVDFAGSGRALHVTPEAVFVAQNKYDSDFRSTYTDIQYVDISDLKGEIELGGSISVEGRLSWGEKGELQLDHFRNHLRLATDVSGYNEETGRWENRIRMSTVSTADIHNLKVQGTLDIAPGHRLLATKFSGDLAYLFHATNVDPLEIIDLRDPANLRSLSILEIDGFVNRIDVRGDKLIALGNMRGESGQHLTAYVFDVEDPVNPALLGSTKVGERWPWTSANHDLKSYSIVDELGLVMLPVSESRTDENGRWSYRQWLQLISFDLDACEAGAEADCINARGEIDGAGYVRRAFPVEDRIVSFSDIELTTADVSNLDAPKITNSFELASDIQNFRVMRGYGLMLVGKGDYYNRSAELRVVDAGTPDEFHPLTTLKIDSPAGALHEVGDSRLLLVASDYYSGETIFTLIDVRNPLRPWVVGQEKTPELGFHYWRRSISWMPTPAASDYVVAGHNLVALTFPKLEDGGDLAEAPGAKLRIFNIDWNRELLTLELGAENLVDMTTVGTKVYVTTYDSVPTTDVDPAAGSSDPASDDASAAALLPGRTIAPWRPRYETVAYKLRVIDVADAFNPTATEAMSVPGKFAGVTQYGDVSVLFTTDTSKSDEQVYQSFDAMTLSEGKAHLDDVFGLVDGIDKIFVDNGRGFFVRNPNSWGGPIFLESDSVVGDEGINRSEFVALDLAWTGNVHSTAGGNVTIRLAGTPVDLGSNVYASLNHVENGLAIVTGAYNSLQVFDIADPKTDMPLLGSFRSNLGWWGSSTYLSEDDHLFLANGLYGLQVISIDR